MPKPGMELAPRWADERTGRTLPLVSFPEAGINRNGDPLRRHFGLWLFLFHASCGCPASMDGSRPRDNEWNAPVWRESRAKSQDFSAARFGVLQGIQRNAVRDERTHHLRRRRSGVKHPKRRFARRNHHERISKRHYAQHGSSPGLPNELTRRESELPRQGGRNLCRIPQGNRCNGFPGDQREPSPCCHERHGRPRATPP